MFTNWTLKLAAKEVEALTKLGLADEFVSAMTKIDKTVHLDFKSFNAYKSLHGWLRSQTRDQALANVDKWADLMINFFLTINIQKITGKSKEDLESTWFKKGLVEYIENNTSLCYALYTGGAIPKADYSEFDSLLKTSSKEIGLTPKETSSLKEAAVAGSTLLALLIIASIVVVPSFAIIYSIYSGLAQAFIEKIPGASDLKDAFPGITKVPWWVWAILIIGIGMAVFGVGWSKIRPKGKK